MNMNASRTSAVAALFLTIVGVGPARLPAAQSQVPAANGTDPSRALLTTYCTGCHNQRLRTGGLSLDDADTGRIGANAEIWEKVAMKLSSGMMPPLGRPRPDPPAEASAFVAALYQRLDQAAAARAQSGTDRHPSAEPD